MPRVVRVLGEAELHHEAPVRLLPGVDEMRARVMWAPYVSIALFEGVKAIGPMSLHEDELYVHVLPVHGRCGGKRRDSGRVLRVEDAVGHDNERVNLRRTYGQK